MASGLALRSLFGLGITRSGRRCARNAHDLLMESWRCLPTTEIKSSDQYSPRPFHRHFYATSAAYPESEKCKVQIVGDGKELQVVWPGESGEESTYRANWLKHSCQCFLCLEKGPMIYTMMGKEPDPSEITISRAILTGTAVQCVL